MKEKNKTESHYFYTLKIGGKYETLKIIQEENVEGRNALKLEYYQERWRTPEDMIELLKKVIIVLEKDFKLSTNTA